MILVYILVILVVISVSFAIGVIYLSGDLLNIGVVFDKSIGYFGSLGLPTILFYWEWKRNKDQQDNTDIKHKDKINKLVSKIQAQLPECLNIITRDSGKVAWNHLSFSYVVQSALATKFNLEERKFILRYLESKSLLLISLSGQIELINMKFPNFQDIISDLKNSKGLIKFYEYIE